MVRGKPGKPKGKNVAKESNWFKDNWGWLAGGGLLTWMMLDDSSDEKLQNVGNGIGGLFGGLFSGLMPCLVSSGSLACVLFVFFCMITATSSRM